MTTMTEAAARQCRLELGAAIGLMRGLHDPHRAVEPQAGMKTAGWIIGHLCATGDYGRKICGRAAFCPKGWRAKFNPGTHPSHDAAEYPPMTELIDTFNRIYTDLIDGALAQDDAARNAPNPFTPIASDLPTAGEFVAYLMTGHLAYHLGQLQAWRVAAGVSRAGGA